MPASLAALVVLGLPRVAMACATCVSSPYGDRTYNIAYLGLMLTPFALLLAIGGVLTRYWWAARRRVGDDPTDPVHHEEPT